VAKRLRIRQVKSGIGSPGDQRRTLRALGIRHHQAQVEQEDSPAIRGMIAKVSHLVEVREVNGNE
jgi:large subunit ribosomal protein L30